MYKDLKLAMDSDADDLRITQPPIQALRYDTIHPINNNPTALDVHIWCQSDRERWLLRDAITYIRRAISINGARVIPVLEMLAHMNIDEVGEYGCGNVSGFRVNGTFDNAKRKYAFGQDVFTKTFRTLAHVAKIGSNNVLSIDTADVAELRAIIKCAKETLNSRYGTHSIAYVTAAQPGEPVGGDFEEYVRRDCAATHEMFRLHNALESNPVTIKIHDVFFGPKATTVKWSDGTTTTVKRRKGDDDNPDIAVAMAIVKKCYGSVPKYHKFVAGFMEKSKERYKNRLNRLHRKGTKIQQAGHWMSDGDNKRMGAILEWLHPEHVYFEKDMNTDAFARADRVDPKVNVFPSGSVKRLSNVLKNATEQPAAEPIDRTDE